MSFIFTLLIVFALLLGPLLATGEGVRSQPVYRWTAVAALLQATLFFGSVAFVPADPIDAWGFQRSYAVFCVLAVVAATFFIQKSFRAPERDSQPPRGRTAAHRERPRGESAPGRTSAKTADKRVDGRPRSRP